MGCDLLGLELVRNWEFLLPGASSATGLGGDVVDPFKMLKRRSSLVVQDLPVSPLAGKFGSGPLSPVADKAKTNKPPPTMFEEPDAGSLLDSFGF